MLNRRRFILSIALCLLCGILTNIAVAWWLALRPAQNYSAGTSASANIRPAGKPIYVSIFPSEFRYRIGAQSIAVSSHPTEKHFINREIATRIATDFEATEKRRTTPWVMGAGDVIMPPLLWPTWMPNPPDDDSEYSYWEGRATGWPFLSLSSLVFTPAGELLPRTSWQLRIQPPPHKNLNDPSGGTIPLRPIPLGFAANSLLFALPFALVPLTFALFRRMKRHRTGHCKACGYSLAGLPPQTPCPECNAVS